MVDIEQLQNDRDALRLLLEEHQILKETIENSPLQFCVYDRQDNLVAWNDTYERTHPEAFAAFRSKPKGSRLSYGELVRYQLAKTLPPEELDEAVAARVLAQRESHGEPVDREYDSIGWLRVIKYPMPSGAIAGMGIDINELKRRECELEEARSVAEAAEKSKSEFLANMSHEIRTPMNGVMGMAELLASTELDAKQRMFTDVIVKSGASLLTIINDILDFSKIDAGLMQLDPEPFALAEAIEDVATLVSTRAADKDVELIVRVDPALPEMVVGDVGRIRQVLTNLVGNAVKFTDQGHVYVDVNGEIVDDGNGGRVAALNVRVEDTGIGIAPDKLAKAFDKFSQVDSSATRKHEGTGLGLAIASSLIDLMGGEIGAESEEGVGSTFWFKVRLPVHGAAECKKRVPVDVTGANVVIIDDNKVNRAILGEQMRAWRFESADCQSGEEGLALLRAAHAAGVGVDAVILDFQMPGMSGEEVLREIRNDPALGGLAVIMLTSVDYAKSHPSVADLVLQAVLTKPTRSSLLLETIVDVISQRRSNGEMMAIDAIEALCESAGDIALPVAKSPMAGLARSDQPAETVEPLDILVAEDNEVNRMVLHQILSDTGYCFEIVENGKLAVEKYLARSPKIILMDVSMPEMDGHEATYAIRQLEAENGGHVPIIAVTAHAMKDDRQNCIDAGMDDYLSKPVSPARVLEKVQQWIDGSRALLRA
ncbi:MAG: response regulator [Nitratireductor sp.]